MAYPHLSASDMRTPLPDSSFVSLIMDTCASQKTRESNWCVEIPDSQDDPQIDVFHKQARKRQQGWKLHISATCSSAESILCLALPVLLAEPTRFKVAASLQWLAALNEGQAGLSQIGKFITVYPVDDAQAIRLARELDRATRGQRGPAVPSDRPLHPASLVHYRYGGFSERLTLTREGTLLPTIVVPSGATTEDRRATSYRPPSWALDPFLVAGVSKPITPLPAVLQGRYLIIASLHQSARGAIYEAVNLKLARHCIIKRAYHDGLLDQTQRDARDMLRHEAQILTQLEGVLPVPRIYELFEAQSDLWLVMEYVEGTLLEHAIQNMTREGQLLPLNTLLAWALDLAYTLYRLHQRQVMYRDLKSMNTIVAPDDTLRLIDFGLTHDDNSGERQFHGGSRGYSSPQQIANEPATVADDIYSYGALLYLLATGANPATAPDQADLLARPLHLLNPALPASICRIIARCLSPLPEDRYASLVEVIADLQPLATEKHILISQPGEPFKSERNRYELIVRELAETLGMVVQTAIRGQGASWTQLKRSYQSQVVLRDVGNGLAGVLLVLAEIVEGLDLSHLRATLHDGACWLLHASHPAGPLLPGLYSGEAGVGAALLRVGQVLHDSLFIEAAEEKGRFVASCPYDLPELLHGTAGRVKYHVQLWHATGKANHLKAAIQAGMVLLEQAEEARDGGVYWKTPEGHGKLSGKIYPGYAHGVAGIADALLDLSQASGRFEFLQHAQRAGNWLRRCAQPVGSGSHALGWQRVQGEKINAAFWCHGSGGIARFFLNAARQDAFPRALDLARGAAQAAADGTRWAGPSRCHGLAGSIEVFLDLYEYTGEQQWLHTACTFAHLLEAYASERDGMRVWLSDEPPGSITPGFLKGYTGIAATLLHLSMSEVKYTTPFHRLV